MRLLLDSHIALWWLAAHPSLGSETRMSIGSADEVFFSSVTPWELGIKKALGKISYPDDLVQALGASGFVGLEIKPEHAVMAPRLPLHHRDPFDRMLVAQALLESLVLVTADRQLGQYDVKLLDAKK